MASHRIILEWDGEENELGITEDPGYLSYTSWSATEEYVLAHQADGYAIVRESKMSEDYLAAFVVRCREAIYIISEPSEHLRKLHQMTWEL